MNIRKRLEVLETRNSPAVPFLITLEDGTTRCLGREMTRAQWREEYGEQIDAERRAGRVIFGVDFRPHLPSGLMLNTTVLFN